MDIEKLIERLNQYSQSLIAYKLGADFADACMDAADALEKLQAENKRLNKIVCSIPTTPDSGRTVSQYDKEMSMCAYLDDLEAENEKLRSELKQVKREKDAAVQCIRGIAKSGRVWMCPYCVHAKDTTGGIAECELDVGVCMMPYSKFEWRGPHKED